MEVRKGEQADREKKLIRKPKQADPARGLMNNLNVNDDSAVVAAFALFRNIYSKIKCGVFCLRGELEERRKGFSLL